MSDLEFLDAPEGAEEDVRAEANQPEPAQEDARPAPERGPDGKFVAKAAEPAPEAPADPAPEPKPEPRPEPKAEPGHVPITALLEERDKRKALEERLRSFEAQQQRQPLPDPRHDPAAFAAYQAEQVQQTLINERLNISERFARKEYGNEAVDKARDAALARFADDPLYYQQVMTQADPYEFVVQEYKRQQAFEALSAPGRLDAFLAWQAQQQAQPAAPAQAVPPTPAPRSLASAPSAGGAKPGETPIGEGAAFDDVFRN